MRNRIIIWTLLAIMVVSILPALATSVDEESPIMVHLTGPFDMDAKPDRVGKPPKDDPTPDPVEVLPWGVERIGGGALANTGDAIKVAVIDTGIDGDHPDLNVVGGINFVPSGRKLDTSKWNDDNGHGTHVAGTIAALDNEIGVIGVAPDVDLYAVKVLDRRGSGYISWVIGGIEWAIDNHMDVITMSLSIGSDVEGFEEVCDAAYAAGIVIVAASGNDGSTVDWPAAYDSVIAVGATDAGDNRASFSNYGSELEMSAPGVLIPSTWKDGGYNTISGTSMAAPHVTGVVAIILSANPGFTHEQARDMLNNTADDLGTAGWDIYFGHGLVDAQLL